MQEKLLSSCKIFISPVDTRISSVYWPKDIITIPAVYKFNKFKREKKLSRRHGNIPANISRYLVSLKDQFSPCLFTTRYCDLCVTCAMSFSLSRRFSGISTRSRPHGFSSVRAASARGIRDWCNVRNDCILHTALTPSFLLTRHVSLPAFLHSAARVRHVIITVSALLFRHDVLYN